MPNFKIIKLTNFTPLHMGAGKEHYDSSAAQLHSDTLSAALCAMRAQMGKIADLQTFLQSFTLSSAFPFWESSYFLPRLKGRLPVEVIDKKEAAYRKQLKNIKFIASPLWNKMVNGEDLKIQANQIQGEFIVDTSCSSFASPYVNQVSQRVTVPREDNEDAHPFFFDWVYFNEKAGLYCLIDCPDDLFDEIAELFSILGESGVGTDKNVGGGKFTSDKSATLNLPQVEGADSMALLSLYIPTEEEIERIDLSNAYYNLVLRGGYMAGSTQESIRHLRKQSIYMFDTGSLFPVKGNLSGKVVDLSPQWNDPAMHKVYRSGKPFCLPVKQKN